MKNLNRIYEIATGALKFQRLALAALTFIAMGQLATTTTSAHADTTDRCGHHDKAVPKACTLACEQTNEIRQQHGLGPVEVEVGLCQAAIKQAQDLNRRFGSCPYKGKERIKCLSHSDGSGADLARRMQKADLGTRVYGENINIGYETLDSAYGGWMRSPHHRKNLLHRPFQRTGYGRVGEYRVQIFAQ